MRNVLGRLALILAGLAGGFLLLEAGLQVAAQAIRATGREMPAQWATSRFRVLCIGDSNTYGLWLERYEAYPAQLEALWNETEASPKMEVLNLGTPGTNTTRVRRDFPRILETFAPDLVIVMLGVNDFWTRPFHVEGTPEAARRNFLEKHSLVYKLYYLIARSFDTRELEVEVEHRDPGLDPAKGRADHRIRFGDEEFVMGYEGGVEGDRGDRELIVRSLTRIVRQAESYGVPLHLMTYPARWLLYRPANESIREAARETGAPLIDLTEVFVPLCAQKRCPEYFFEDLHPNARGYRVLAETVAERLRADLR